MGHSRPAKHTASMPILQVSIAWYNYITQNPPRLRKHTAASIPVKGFFCDWRFPAMNTKFSSKFPPLCNHVSCYQYYNTNTHFRQCDVIRDAAMWRMALGRAVFRLCLCEVKSIAKLIQRKKSPKNDLRNVFTQIIEISIHTAIQLRFTCNFPLRRTWPSRDLTWTMVDKSVP